MRRVERGAARGVRRRLGVPAGARRRLGARRPRRRPSSRRRARTLAAEYGDAPVIGVEGPAHVHDAAVLARGVRRGAGRRVHPPPPGRGRGLAAHAQRLDRAARLRGVGAVQRRRARGTRSACRRSAIGYEPLVEDPVGDDDRARRLARGVGRRRCRTTRRRPTWSSRPQRRHHQADAGDVFDDPLATDVAARAVRAAARAPDGRRTRSRCRARSPEPRPAERRAARLRPAQLRVARRDERAGPRRARTSSPARGDGCSAAWSARPCRATAGAGVRPLAPGGRPPCPIRRRERHRSRREPQHRARSPSCASARCATTPGGPFELVVGDAGSTDGSLAMLRDFEARGWLRLEVAAGGRKHAEWLDLWLGRLPDPLRGLQRLRRRVPPAGLARRPRRDRRGQAGGAGLRPDAVAAGLVRAPGDRSRAQARAAPDALAPDARRRAGARARRRELPVPGRRGPRRVRRQGRVRRRRGLLRRPRGRRA